ncbi:septum formation initiator [Micromonospora craniellae]|uniref:Septum formation initiator n=1 Tax=Micromonospora craniellae TaxID=2294034 RepID=A0A372FX49_9ACTN|nr:septum formation initiator [Micromonospora craniellae]QOC93277.1 septum formation initiator [Micromonospora craniellae]RFS45382.1 septum formation initiator [Micromonospora craniellae]
MGRRTLLAVAGWLATAVVATLIGLAAIRLVGESLTGTPGGVRSQEEIARELAAPPRTVGTTSGTPGPTGSPEPTGTPPVSPTPDASHRRSFSNPGGSVVAECVPGGVWLAYWSPKQGYSVEDVDRGPDDDAEVKFVGPSGEHELSVRCQAGVPVLDLDDD